MNTISIASSAMIGSLNISVWEARKLDKNTQAEVLANKGAKSRRAATVSKHLFSECPSLEAIKTLRGEARVWFNNATLPWDDNGGRLITTAQYLRVMEQAAKYEQRFNDLLNVWVRCSTAASTRLCPKCVASSASCCPSARCLWPGIFVWTSATKPLPN
jgi:hypothetical protein